MPGTPILPPLCGSARLEITRPTLPYCHCNAAFQPCNGDIMVAHNMEHTPKHKPCNGDIMVAQQYCHCNAAVQPCNGDIMVAKNIKNT